jgi:hypothetical protein
MPTLYAVWTGIACSCSWCSFIRMVCRVDDAVSRARGVEVLAKPSQMS